MKKSLIKMSFVFLFLSLCSQVHAAKGAFLQDGIYSYDYERFVDCIEITAQYKSFGMEAWQTISKKSWGNAVYVEDGSFVEPETRILVSISDTGKISSPDNPSVNGKIRRNGKFFFQGYYEENAQMLKFAISGNLVFSKDGARASKEYDGNFTLVDNGTQRKQKVRIEKGLYLWNYEDKQEDDFETWPVIVDADGKIDSGFEMTVRSGVKGLSDMVSSTSQQSLGTVTPDGSISLRTLTNTAGSGQSVASDTINYTGMRGTENLNKITKDEDQVSDIKKAYKKQRTKKSSGPKANPPEWYSDFIENDEFFIYGTAQKTNDDRATALKVAELTAASQIMMNLSHEANVRVESEKKGSQDENSKQKIESRMFMIMDSFSNINIPYSVKESFYDEETKTAYVVAVLKREDAEKILSENKIK